MTVHIRELMDAVKECIRQDPANADKYIEIGRRLILGLPPESR